MSGRFSCILFTLLATHCAHAADYFCGPVVAGIPFELKEDGSFPIVEISGAGRTECFFIASKDDRVTIAITVVDEGRNLNLSRRDEATVQHYFARRAQSFEENSPAGTAVVVSRLEKKRIAGLDFTCFTSQKNMGEGRWTEKICHSYKSGTKMEIWFQVPDGAFLNAGDLDNVLEGMRRNET